MKRHLLILAALGLPALSATADSATSFADAAKRHRIGDTAAAMAFWQPLAQQGDTNAAYNLAVIHEYGDGVTKSLPEGFKWYRIAAERGDRASQSRLGTMYLNGEGTAKDEKEGWRWILERQLASPGCTWKRIQLPLCIQGALALRLLSWSITIVLETRWWRLFQSQTWQALVRQGIL